MGELLTRFAADYETHELNKLWGHPDVDRRKRVGDRCLDRRDEFPKFLEPGTAFPPNNRRQRSIRFAASELMRHVGYRRLDPSRGAQREFLRWLSWLESTAANWQQAREITKVLDYFITRHQNGFDPPRVLFDWEEAAANLAVAVVPSNYNSTHPTLITVKVTAPDAFHVSNTPDDD